MRTLHTPIDQTSNNTAPLPRHLFTIRNFAERHSSFLTVSAVTNQVFKAEPRQSTKGEIPGNGMMEFGAIVRVGRKVLIDEMGYFQWLDAQQNESAK